MLHTEVLCIAIKCCVLKLLKEAACSAYKSLQRSKIAR